MMVMTWTSEGRVVVVCIGGVVVWVKGGREYNRVDLVTRGSILFLEGETMLCFLRVKIEVKTSRDFLPEMVVSSRMTEKGI